MPSPQKDHPGSLRCRDDRAVRPAPAPGPLRRSWLVPTVLGDMMKDPDRARARRVMEAVLQMKKLDIARLEDAFAIPKVSEPMEVRQ
jgi:hypothetical protein